MTSKPRTDGVSPKVPTQAIVTTLTFVLAYFGVEISVEAAGSISVVLGFIAGLIAKPGAVVPG